MVTSRSLQVGFVTGQLGQGGSERQLTLLAQGLAARGHRVTVACLSHHGEPYGSYLRDSGIEVMLFPRRGSWDLRRMWRLRRWFRDRQLDAVCAFGDFAVAYTHFALLRSRGRPRFIALIRRGESQLGPLKRRLVQRTFRGADLVYANSEVGRRYAAGTLRLPPERVHLLPNVIPEEVFRFRSDSAATRRAMGVRPGEPVLVYVGRDATAKDIPTLCRTLARLQRTSLGLHAWIVGPGLDERPAGCPDPGEQASWLGPRDEVLSLIAAADVLFLTSRSEGMPNVILEALALGCPVVSTAAGDTRQLLDATGSGLVRPVGDARALADAVAEVLGDPAPFRARARAAIEVVQGAHGLEAALRDLCEAMAPAGGRRTVDP